MHESSLVSKRLLLNAEPFGFGPAAAIATFFPMFRERFGHIAYIGSGHTLDLQRPLPYDDIFDLSERSERDVDAVLSGYDVFLTATDFGMAERAKACGSTVIIYDPLTWYWKEVPAAVCGCDLYLPQDFFGVRERLASEPDAFPESVRVVPPIVAGRRRSSGKHVLINLGGLQNPFWSVDEAVRYAESCVGAILGCVPPGDGIVIATSGAIARRLSDGRAKSYPRNGMLDILAETRYAFMTPGLGNIYDAAEYGIPVVWLPPANDSQGQQLELLRRNGMVDAVVDWSELDCPIDYFAEQPEVLRNISEAVNGVSPAGALSDAVRCSYEAVVGKNIGAAAGLLDKFGTGGAQAVVDAVCGFVIAKD
ncbi:MAG: hypothetical protein HGA31_02530 [Candidatus Moranbacteria bacterium]|nr:hypothetical protein [Candidatus Moranbacteria bacterium]